MGWNKATSARAVKNAERAARRFRALVETVNQPDHELVETARRHAERLIEDARRQVQADRGLSHDARARDLEALDGLLEAQAEEDS